MGKILRDPAAAAGESHDLIIIGGGVYGIMLSLEASRRNLRSLLLEKDDFGGGTSFNSLRIIHGGLRYLQSLDLTRFRESVMERKWFLSTFPDFVEPLPCLMPLYGDALRRPSILRMALFANDFLSYSKNRSVRPDRHLPDGKVITGEETQDKFPRVDPSGLKGGAVWYDALMPDSQRILMETLRYSIDNGASTLNYVEAKELIQKDNAVRGVVALDQYSGNTYEYKSHTVINAAGPWSREVAKSFDRDVPSLFVSSIAWNILFKRESLADFGLAVTPRNPAGQTYFIIPYKGMLLAGTGHGPAVGVPADPWPTEEFVASFIGEINRAVPDLALDERDVLHIYSGYLPVKEESGIDLTNRAVIHDHGKNGGPAGLYSVSGIKFTTARSIAEKILNHIYPEKARGQNRDLHIEVPEDRKAWRGQDLNGYLDAGDARWIGPLKTLIDEESVLHLDDLLFRRTSVCDDPDRALSIAPRVCELFGWDEARSREEVARVRRIYRNNDPLLNKVP